MNGLPYNIQFELEQAYARQRRVRKTNEAVQMILGVILIGVGLLAPKFFPLVAGVFICAQAYFIGCQLDRFDCFHERLEILIKGMLIELQKNN